MNYWWTSDYPGSFEEIASSAAAFLKEALKRIGE
jgi:hypothetical protein